MAQPVEGGQAANPITEDEAALQTVTEMEVFYTFTWAPKPRAPRGERPQRTRRPEGAPGGGLAKAQDFAIVSRVVRLHDHRRHRRPPQHEDAIRVGMAIHEYAGVAGVRGVVCVVLLAAIGQEPHRAELGGDVLRQRLAPASERLRRVVGPQHGEARRVVVSEAALSRCGGPWLGAAAHVGVQADERVGVPRSRGLHALGVGNQLATATAEAHLEGSAPGQRGRDVARQATGEVLLPLTQCRRVARVVRGAVAGIQEDAPRAESRWQAQRRDDQRRAGIRPGRALGVRASQRRYARDEPDDDERRRSQPHLGSTLHGFRGHFDAPGAKLELSVRSDR